MAQTIDEKLAILADAAKYDASCASSGAKRSNPGKGLGNATGMGICHAYTPDGRCISLLKILLTNVCIYECRYCVNRVSSNTRRARFTPEEVVWLTLEFYKRNYIEGLFLSSGIVRSIDYTMEQLTEVARSLREDHAFNGYIHLKAVPGASAALIEQAGRYADRLSANVELPRQVDLDALAPAKTVADVEDTMDVIAERRREAQSERRAPSFAPAGQSTQMIVGATDATDAAILRTATRLYRRHDLRRVYYTAYSPIPEPSAALPSKPPPLMREHRLYQADWLIRVYGFAPTEVISDEVPNLPLDIDPKVAWALRNRHRFPVDIRRASQQELTQVPGIGLGGARKIVETRRHRTLTLDDLRRMRILVARAAPFLTGVGPNPFSRFLDAADLRARLAPPPVQGSLFEPQGEAA